MSASSRILLLTNAKAPWRRFGATLLRLAPLLQVPHPSAAVGNV